MQKLSLKKQLTIVRLYLAGLSYDEIAARCGVSKGTVANVIADLKAGRILDVQAPLEQLEQLRELAVDLRRLKLTPGQAVVGVAALSHLQELEIEPADIQRWAATCRELTGEGAEVQAFVRAAVALEEVRERTGLSVEALEDKVRGLEEGVAHLEPLARELRGCQRELKELEKRRQALASEVSQLEKRHEPLRKEVIQKERREAELSHRIQESEQRAQAADERLAAARKDLKVLAGLGLSPDDLPGFVHRLSAIAQRHSIEPAALRERLLHELEQLEAGLGLEAFVEMKQREMTEAEQATLNAQEERAELEAAVQQLRQEKAALHAAVAEELKHVRKTIRTIAPFVRDAAAELRREFGSGVGGALLEVEKLRAKALELGKELGHFEATIEANQWLQTLVGLVKGNGDVSSGDVRLVGLAVLRGVKSWTEQNKSQISLPYWFTPRVDATIEALEQWEV